MKRSLKVIEKIRVARGMTGAIYQTPNGTIFYLADRYLKQIFRNNEPTISAAIAKGVACWALDDTTLLTLRTKQIKVVGILVRDNQDMWLSTLDAFMDKEKAPRLNYEARNGSMQRYLPLKYFTHKPGHLKL